MLLYTILVSKEVVLMRMAKITVILHQARKTPTPEAVDISPEPSDVEGASESEPVWLSAHIFCGVAKVMHHTKTFKHFLFVCRNG